ncbi:hypothetical protein ACFQZZ_18505 [Nocardia sp. GCM10030253]|uniref:hypothetical protein n=1 Tax=Nocardia sp. GCM10030253 TaxID=3273404 RepID=UPI003627C85F
MKDDFIKMWEKKIGREMTPEELKTLDRGCIGVTAVRLGVDGNPPLNLSFDDPIAHQAIAKAQKVLAPGDAANGRVSEAKHLLADARRNLAKILRDGATEDSQVVRDARTRVERNEKNVAEAEATAKKTWAKISDEYKAEKARTEAKIEGGMRTFEKVSKYAEKFNAILATKPANVMEFMRLVKADKDLAQLSNVDTWLPDGNPSEWEAVIFSKHFWSGSRDGVPDPARFAPDPITGQVSMSGQFTTASRGYINFDYGWYDPQSKSWWHANHMEYTNADKRASSPMKVYQSSPRTFFTGYTDFDSSVISIGFVRRPPQ